jgi:hypothetical protein
LLKAANMRSRPSPSITVVMFATCAFFACGEAASTASGGDAGAETASSSGGSGSGASSSGGSSGSSGASGSGASSSGGSSGGSGSGASGSGGSSGSSGGSSGSSGASGSTSGGPGPDAGCPAIDRSCSKDGDCVAYVEPQCCCDHYAGRRAATPYTTCVPNCGARGCGCSPSADDRQSVGSLAMVGVTCDAGSCWTFATH